MLTLIANDDIVVDHYSMDGLFTMCMYYQYNITNNILNNVTNNITNQSDNNATKIIRTCEQTYIDDDNERCIYCETLWYNIIIFIIMASICWIPLIMWSIRQCFTYCSKNMYTMMLK